MTDEIEIEERPDDGPAYESPTFELVMRDPRWGERKVYLRGVVWRSTPRGEFFERQLFFVSFDGALWHNYSVTECFDEYPFDEAAFDAEAAEGRAGTEWEALIAGDYGFAQSAEWLVSPNPRV